MGGTRQVDDGAQEAAAAPPGESGYPGTPARRIGSKGVTAPGQPVADNPATVAWCAQRGHPWLTYNPLMDRTWCRCGARQAPGEQPHDWDAARELFHDHPRGTPCRCYLPATAKGR